MRIKYKYKYILANLLIFLVMCDCQCQRQNQHSDFVVTKITLDMSENLLKVAEAQQIDPKLLLQDALNNDPSFLVNPEKSDSGVLHLSLVISSQDNELLLIGNLMRKDQEQLAFAEIDFTADQEALKQKLSVALAYLRQQLVGGVQKSDLNYLALIKNASEGQDVNPITLTNALQRARDKKDKKSLPYVISLLGSTSNLGIANACLMLLAQLQDNSALPAIIDFAHGKPALIRRQAIIAARHMPSKLCAEWLVVMAYGHDDPMVRKEALKGLLEVEDYLKHN